MDVKVIKASDEPVIRDRKFEGNAFEFNRKRVAAYVRVSTDDEEQLNSLSHKSNIIKKKYLKVKNGF